MKANAAISSIILIILILAMATGYIVMNLEASRSEESIAFKKAEILKVKNTFYLLNKSLEKTWRVSTIQTIFDAGDGLGLGYWYKGTNGEKTIVMPTGDCNDYTNPKICLPVDISEHLVIMMQDYLNIKDKVKLDGVDTSISKIEPEITVTDDEIISIVRQKIDVSFGNTKISAETTNTNTITSNFNKLVAAGRELVNAAIELSDKSKSKNEVEKYFDDKFNEVLENSGLNGKLEKNVLTIGDKVYYDISAIFYDENQYDYYDEEGNSIEKKPFFLTVKLEDYL